MFWCPSSSLVVLCFDGVLLSYIWFFQFHISSQVSVSPCRTISSCGVWVRFESKEWRNQNECFKSQKTLIYDGSYLLLLWFAEVQERTAELHTQAAVTAYKRPTPTTKSLTACEVADLVIDNVYAAMSSAMDYTRSYLESRYWDGVKPKLWLRFGTMLFHSRQSRCNILKRLNCVFLIMKGSWRHGIL